MILYEMGWGVRTAFVCKTSCLELRNIIFASSIICILDHIDNCYRRATVAPDGVVSGQEDGNVPAELGDDIHVSHAEVIQVCF